MLGSRFFHLDRELFKTTVNIHKICALTWICGMPLSVLSRFKTHWANIRTFLLWGPKDLVWMIQSARSLYNKSAAVPAAGRFNTGQKINACLVILYYLGFVSTGILIYTKGSILIPWYVHTALFFSAMGSTGGHLFLALVNPSTRIALAGIFHGWAPMKYIEHHHVLSLPPALQAHTHAVDVKGVARELLVSKLEIGGFILAFVLSGVGLYAFGLGRMATAKSQFDQRFADVIQPSQLTTKHRIGPTAESCTKCHTFTGELPDRNCEECHQDVKSRRTLKLGYHGTLKGDCRTCHREHRESRLPLVPLDREKFNHNEAAFHLEGKHVQLKCEDCHEKKRTKETPGVFFIGLKYGKCSDCHEDQHKGQFQAACNTCHTPAGWTGKNLTFRHETQADFKLVGKHATLDCQKCHKPATFSLKLGTAKFKGLAQDCASCHADPHEPQLAQDCTRCHTPDGWQGANLKFVHNRDAKFSLVAKHEAVACVKCHKPVSDGAPLAKAKLRGLPSATCASCHNDPHGGQFAQDCMRCHTTPVSWKVATLKFQHDHDTKFSLVGKHAVVQCEKCHQPQSGSKVLASARFRDLPQDCASCHQIKHPDTYGRMCTSCHTPFGWAKKEPPFDHARDAGFDLMGKHLVAKCSACHGEAVVGVIKPGPRLAPVCYSCHQKDDPHKGVLGEECSKCHVPVGWKGEDLIFEHNTMARFILDRDHDHVSCAKCHINGKFKPLDTACSACHTKFFLDDKKSNAR
jgi:cytochrome b subunit of formate dehydrogenase